MDHTQPLPATRCYLDDDLEELGLHPECVMCEGTSYGQMSNPSVAWKK